MKDQATRRSLRGAIYTRVSTDQGLEQDFNSLDAQREACEASIKSFEGGQERAIDPDDPVARFPRAGHRQGGSRRTPAARLWSQASRRPADGLAGSVAHARTRLTNARIRSSACALNEPR